MSLSNLLVTSQKIIGTWSWILEAFMGKLPCYVSLLTTLTPRCLIGKFIVKKGARRMTAILQVPGMKTILVNEEHIQSLTLLTWHGPLPSILCLKTAILLYLLLSSSSSLGKCFIRLVWSLSKDRYFWGLEWFYQLGCVSLSKETGE